MRYFWSRNKHAVLEKWAYEARPLTKMQEVARGLDNSNSYQSFPTVISRHQVFSRIEIQAISTQYRIQAVEK